MLTYATLTVCWCVTLRTLNPMNTKSLLGLSSLLAVTLAASSVDAGPRHGGGNGGNRSASRAARSSGIARSFNGGGNRFVGNTNRAGNWNRARFTNQRFVGNRNWNANRNWSGQRFASNHWNNNWNWNHHHHHHGSSVVFFDVAFPFWGWWGYPYYDSGYYPYGSSYGYGSGYYGSYNYNYGNGYDQGYDNGNGHGYSNGYDSKVAELQRRLANAGYYRGEIDGIFGSRTEYADRKSTRLNSSHMSISYAVFCLKKKKKE